MNGHSLHNHQQQGYVDPTLRVVVLLLLQPMPQQKNKYMLQQQVYQAAASGSNGGSARAANSSPPARTQQRRSGVLPAAVSATEAMPHMAALAGEMLASPAAHGGLNLPFGVDAAPQDIAQAVAAAMAALRRRQQEQQQQHSME